MSMVVTIANQKGGVGKTTTAVTLASGLARKHYRVLLIDLDGQGNCADALGVEKDNGLQRFLVMEDDAARTVRENLDLIASNKSTVKVKQIITGENFRERILKLRLQDPAMRRYDVIMLDTAPGADVLQINALVAADYVLLPVNLDHLATVGATDIIKTIASLKQMDAFTGKFLGILPTMWDRVSNESHTQLQAMIEQFDRQVWPPIPVDVRAREAPRFGKTLWEFCPASRVITGLMINGQQLGGYCRVMHRLISEVGL